MIIRCKFVWKIWSKQHPRKLNYYSLDSVKLAKTEWQNLGHTKVYIKKVR